MNYEGPTIEMLGDAQMSGVEGEGIFFAGIAVVAALVVMVATIFAVVMGGTAQSGGNSSGGSTGLSKVNGKWVRTGTVGRGF